MGFNGVALGGWPWSAVKETEVGRTAGADCGRVRIAPLIVVDAAAATTEDEDDEDEGCDRSRLMLRLATVGVVRRPKRLSRLRLRLRRPPSPLSAYGGPSDRSDPMASFRR